MNTLNLILIPGFMGRASDFESVVVHLPPYVNAKVIPPTPPEGLASRASFDDVVQAWYEHHKKVFEQPYVLLGYSLGGRVALALSRYLRLKQNENLLGLILEGAHPGLTDESEIHKRRASDENWLREFTSKPLTDVLRAWYEQPIFASLSEREKGFLVSQKGQLELGDILRQMRYFSLSQQPDLRRWINSADIPIWYISGEYDKKFTQIAEALTGVTHLLAPSCGHNVHFESPSWYARALTQILENEIRQK